VGASHRCPAVKRECPAHRCGVPGTLDALLLDGVPGTLGRAVGRPTCTLVVGGRIVAGTGGITLAVGHADHRPVERSAAVQVHMRSANHQGPNVDQHAQRPVQGSVGQSCTRRRQASRSTTRILTGESVKMGASTCPDDARAGPHWRGASLAFWDTGSFPQPPAARVT
jgi:hypothetical protein